MLTMRRRVFAGGLGPRVITGRRSLAAAGGHSLVFDSEVKRKQRDAAVSAPESSEYDYLRKTIAERVIGRLHDIQRKDFDKALDVGCHAGHIRSALQADVHDGLCAGGIKELVQCDSSEAALQVAQSVANSPAVEALVYDQVDEESLPYESAEFDAVVSSLALHWVNRIPTALSEIRRVLKPDGVFVGALLGATTLNELQYSFAAAEEERVGGCSPHASPSTRIADCGSLMQRAGFSLITVDIDTIKVEYADAFVLMEDLQRMGEQHAPFQQRRSIVNRETFIAMAAAYQSLFGSQEKITATFEVIYIIGWAPHAAQPKPKERGSASHKIGTIIPD